MVCCSTVQCWASLPGMQCCAVQCSAVLPGVLDCSPGCSTEQQSASLPGVQLRTAHRSPGCSASPLRVQRGTAQGRAAHPGVQGITPGVQLRAVQRFWSAAQDSAVLPGVQLRAEHRSRGAAHRGAPCCSPGCSAGPVCGCHPPPPLCFWEQRGCHPVVPWKPPGGCPTHRSRGRLLWPTRAPRSDI